jgi:hypothetical protein
MTPELLAWLQANGAYQHNDGDHDIGWIHPLLMGEGVDPGKVRGGGYEQELSRFFDMQAAQDAQGRRVWGSGGLPFSNDGAQSPYFVNTIAPVTVDGVQYQRVGENIADPLFRQKLIQNNPMAENITRYFDQYDPASVSRYDPQQGYLMQKDKYDELVRAIASTKRDSQNSPFEAFGKTIGPAMGLSGLINGLGGFGNQGLWSSLSQNAAGQGGSFADVLSSFGIDAGSLPDMPWGANPRELGDGVAGAFDASGMGTGVDAGTFASNAGLGQGVTGALFPSVAGPTLGAGFGGATSALGKILSGTADADDYLKLAGVAGSSLLGYLGSESQANAAKDMSDKYLALGAPYRGMLASSYAPGFDLSQSDPAYAGALDQASSAVLRKLSTSGNPFDNPGAAMEAQKYVTQSTALPQLNTYRSQLGAFGQLGINTAGTADTINIGNAGGGLDALGYGLGQLTGSGGIEDMLMKFPGLFGGNMSLNIGRGF